MATIFQRWQLRLVVAWAALAGTGWAQSATHWSSYKMADGLAEPVFNSVCVTPSGSLLATSPHAPLATELDGYAVSNFPAPPGNLGRIGESPGGQRWAASAQGLLEFKDGTWMTHPLRELAAAVQAGFPATGGAPPFFPVRQGCVLLLLPAGLMEFTEENPDAPRTLVVRRAADSQIGPFTGMAVARDGGLWISGARGLARMAGPVRNLGPNSDWREFLRPGELPGPLTQPEPDDNGGLVLLAEAAPNRRIVLTFDGQSWATVAGEARSFFHAWRGPDHALWAATTEGLYQWVPARTNWVENEDISPGQISDVAVEPEGAFWLATADGLFRGALPLWGKSAAAGNLDQSVASLAPYGESGLWMVAGDQLHLLADSGQHTFALPLARTDGAAAPSLFPLKDGSLLVNQGNRLFQFTVANGFAPVQARPQPAAKTTPLGMLPDGSLCFCRDGESPVLETFDGLLWQPLVHPPPLAAEDLPLTTLYAARNGDLWLGGGPAVWWCHAGSWRRFASQDLTTPKNAAGFADLPGDTLCCATLDQLWEFDGHNWLLLKNRFNHINALLTARDGTVWLASNGGLYRYCGGAWVDNGPAEGLPNGAVGALGESRAGQLWAATSHGVWEFHPEADPAPPRTWVRSLAGTDRQLKEGDILNLSFDGADKWKYTLSERLLYSHQLDQLGWSSFRVAATLSLPNLAAGRHFIQARAMDRAGRVDATPATLEFTVLTPWFRDGRLWVILLLGVAAALFFAAVAWHRHLLLVRSHAAVEQKVAERTRELEIATRELLHSQKMNALGTLAAGIAHDFNNILSIIKGSAQIIEDNPGQPEKIRTRIARIKTVVQQGAEIVDAMLGFGRGAGASAAPCHLNAVVADTLKLLGDRFLRETEVKFVRVENLPELAVPREFVQQILINLIFNAAEAMNERKIITLTTARADRLPPNIFLSPAAAGAYVTVSVRDQGSGMTPEIQARVFEPFFTTKALSTRRGTGLGLSMVYELAKKMGAGLAVQSVVGEGSEFTLILPVPPVPAAETPPGRPAASLHA